MNETLPKYREEEKKRKGKGEGEQDLWTTHFKNETPLSDLRASQDIDWRPLSCQCNSQSKLS